MRTFGKITLILFLVSAPASAQAICVVTASGNVAICPLASGESLRMNRREDIFDV